jgi:hypothetical protein
MDEILSKIHQHINQIMKGSKASFANQQREKLAEIYNKTEKIIKNEQNESAFGSLNKKNDDDEEDELDVNERRLVRLLKVEDELQ